MVSNSGSPFVACREKSDCLNSPPLVLMRDFNRLVSLRSACRAAIAFLAFGARTPIQGAPAEAYVFSHLAGPLGGRGDTDGSATEARFSVPFGVAVDDKGNVYVTDEGDSTIRKITPEGVVTTLAGSAAFPGDFQNGLGAEARFAGPMGVVVDSAGNVYVSDTNNHRIRKITPAGLVSTFAGSGSGESVDGIGTAAGFYYPEGLALDASGNIYVGDANSGSYATRGQSKLRKISSAGVVTTLATGFNQPLGVAVDGTGNVYVTDEGTIYKVSPTGTKTLLAGGRFGSADGNGAAAQFSAAIGLALDRAGNVYVGDTYNSTIRRISPDGTVTTIAGTAGQSGSADGTGPAAQFSRPGGVAVDTAGNVYVADIGGHTIRKLTPDRKVTTMAGLPGLEGSADGTGVGAQFGGATGVTADRAGIVYVADTGNHTIRKITPQGEVSTFAGSAGQSGDTDGTGMAARFNEPRGLALDAAGNLFVADGGNNTVRKITPEGVVSTLAGTAGRRGGYADGTRGAARFSYPSDVAVDRAGNIFVADFGNSAIRRVTPAGVVTTVAGTPGQIGSADGIGVAAQFHGPSGVAIDPSGNVFVADSNNATIRKISPDGYVSTIAGAVHDWRSVDGAGPVARFQNPWYLAVDRNGNVFVSDGTIRKISPEGEVTTIGGIVGQAGTADGISTAARFVAAAGIAVDEAGTLYIADGNSIRKGTPIGGSQLINISTRSLVSTGANLQIAGFVISGSEPKQVLIRASGPVLASAFKMSGVLPNPVLTLFDQKGTPLSTNKGWGGDLAIKAAAQRVGAFAWPETSADSALLVTLPPGPYTAHVTGAGGETGTALIEVYDADGSASSRLTNISTRSLAATSENIQIAGFVITGAHAKQVLIRASGPALSASFNMSGVLADPMLTLFDHAGNQIKQNVGWTSDAVAAPSIRAAAQRVGAFAWAENSADSALLVTLAPGLYTAQLAGKSGGTGTALLEMYDADPN